MRPVLVGRLYRTGLDLRYKRAAPGAEEARAHAYKRYTEKLSDIY